MCPTRRACESAKTIEKPKEHVWKPTYHYTNTFKTKAKHTNNMFFIYALTNDIISFFCLRACSGVIIKLDFLMYMVHIWRATYAVLVFLKQRF